MSFTTDFHFRDPKSALLMQAAMIDAGLAPIIVPEESPRKYLDSLDDATREVCKRKFRKVFRKAVAWKLNELKGNSPSAVYKSSRLDLVGNFKREVALGVPKSKGIKARCFLARRRLVLDYLKSVVLPGIGA